ncbi:MAG: preprotein translocase subunit TatC [Planctomycetes bacterium]|nr:preprotein translocase subunit TatC [Planctomycetota bacterium]
MKFLPGSLPDNPDDVRMTIGEHLDELRSVLVRSLIALLAAALLCIWPTQWILAVIARPLFAALEKHHQPVSILATSPAEPLLIYVKTVLIAALIITAPYILLQAWSFVASGLYKHERAWVHKLVPVSVGLFLAGVLFMYYMMLPVCLDFLIGFSSWLPMPELPHSAQVQAPTTAPAMTQPAIPPVPFLAGDPPDPQVGQLWFNTAEGRLKLKGPEQTYFYRMSVAGAESMIESHIKLDEYLWFVLMLTLAFGAAFQMPLVVVFLARTGIVSVATFRSYRRVVILVIVIIAGMIAPPDLMSHLLLSGPMILLFEIGLWFAGRSERLRSRARSSA